MNGEQFKRLRIKKGFKKRPALAKFLGKSPETIKKWERNERRIDNMAIKLLRAL